MTDAKRRETPSPLWRFPARTAGAAWNSSSRTAFWRWTPCATAVALPYRQAPARSSGCGRQNRRSAGGKRHGTAKRLCGNAARGAGASGRQAAGGDRGATGLSYDQSRQCFTLCTLGKTCKLIIPDMKLRLCWMNGISCLCSTTWICRRHAFVRWAHPLRARSPAEWYGAAASTRQSEQELSPPPGQSSSGDCGAGLPPLGRRTGGLQRRCLRGIFPLPALSHHPEALVCR